MSRPSKKRTADTAEASSSAGREGRRRKKTKLPDFTELAEIYGHPLFGAENPSKHAPLKGIVPLKSGITPLDPGPFETKAELSQFEELEAYQRSRFRGFTTDELQDFESLAPTYLDAAKDNGLDSVPLHPVFARKHWLSRNLQHTAPMPLGNGKEGFWEPSNPVVWDLMLPSLKLASLVISNIHTWPWWDTLLAGRYEPIEKHEIDDDSGSDNDWDPDDDDGTDNDETDDDETGDDGNSDRSSEDLTLSPKKEEAPVEKETEQPDKIHYRVFRRKPEVANRKKAQAEVEKVFNSFCQKIRFSLFPGGEDVWLGLEDDGRADGVCKTLPPFWGSVTSIHMRYGILEPLLDDRITAAERLLCQWMFASSLLHESTHAFWRMIDDTKPGNSSEPYFEYECISELGFSMENAIWGGLTEPFVQLPQTAGGPVAGMFRIPFMTWSNGNRTTEPTLNTTPDGWYVDQFYPAPVPYFSNIQNPEFWDVFIKKSGAKGVHMGPLVNGSSGDLDTGDSTRHFQSRRIHDIHMQPDIIPKPDSSAEDLLYIKYENARRAQARNILNSIDLRIKERKEREKQQKQILKKKTGKPDEKVDSPPAGRNASAIEPPFYRPGISTKRYNEIRDFLFEHYDELALGTLYFKISEHLLLSYILAEDDSSLSPCEWRAFLIRCQNEQKLFSWEEIGYPPGMTRGSVRKIDLGWPPKTRKYLVEGKDFKAPSPEMITWFETRTEDAMDAIAQMNGSEYIGELYDFDEVKFLGYVNRKKMMISAPRFHRLISHYETEKWKNNKQDILVHGPKGIIRMLRAGWDSKEKESDVELDMWALASG